ncbi:hypothetical protein D3C74_228820 [compost metagenome]
MATIYETTGTYKPFEFGLTGVTAAMQRIRIIASTVLGTCVMDRTLGIEDDGQDISTLGSRQLSIARVITAIQEQEPEITIIDVDIIEDIDYERTGRLVPVIRFVMTEEVEK